MCFSSEIKATVCAWQKASDVIISLGGWRVHRSKLESSTEMCNNAVVDQCPSHFLVFNTL